jgi:hypothetical protein
LRQLAPVVASTVFRCWIERRLVVPIPVDGSIPQEQEIVFESSLRPGMTEFVRQDRLQEPEVLVKASRLREPLDHILWPAHGSQEDDAGASSRARDETEIRYRTGPGAPRNLQNLTSLRWDSIHRQITGSIPIENTSIRRWGFRIDIV